jgi:ATPase family associated with various cellular activities (AAA)
MPTGITWDPLLADRLVRGLSLSVLGQQALPEPLSRLLVLGRSDAPPDGRMALAAALVPTPAGGTVVLSPLGLGRHPGATRIPQELAARFQTRPARGGGFFVLDEEFGERFLVAPGLMRHITITCGLWPVLRQIVGPRAPARPTGNVARVAEELDRFCEVVQAVVAAIYEAQELPVPALGLTLRATGASVQGAVTGLRRLGATLVRPATGRSPGEVYDPSSGGEPGEEPTTFSDVGGQDVARAELETICLAVQRPDAFRAWGARPPRGVLLYGPPGTGKTLLARALAHEAGARFLHVRATDVVSKWYGEAEQRVQKAFDRARAEAPAVIFFDEIDALARDRGMSHEATHRMVSTFLENMDGLREAGGVIVLAATNRPEAVDDALLRPGRFDRLVEVPLPGRDDRRSIFRVHMGRAERKAGRPLFGEPTEEEWAALLDASEGFSGADVAETVRRALELKVRSGATVGRIEAAELLAAAGGVARPF